MTTSTSAVGRFAPARALNVSRAALLFGTALGVSLAVNMTAPGKAMAADECGVQAGSTVTCTPAGNPFPAGIDYTPTADLTVVLDPGVVVNSAGNGVTINGGATNFNNGVTTDASDTITAAGTGISVTTNDGSVLVLNSATVNSGGIGVNVGALGTGTVTFVGDGDITTTGASAFGIYGYAQSGGVTIVNSGLVTTGGAGADGVRASATGGDITLVVDDVTTNGSGAAAISADITGAGNLNIVAGDLTTTGSGSDVVEAYADSGDVNVTINSITTSAGSADAIYAYSLTGAVNVDIGTITSNSLGTEAGGIYAGTDGALTVNVDAITIAGDATAIVARGGAGDVLVTSGTISSAGVGRTAITATATTGDVTVNTGSITNTGAGSAGVFAYSGSGDVTVNGAGLITTTDTALSAVSATGNATINSTGGVVVSGTGTVSGLYASAPDGVVNVTNGAAGFINVTTTAGNAYGINVYNDFPDLVTDAGVTVTSPGSITANGANYGIGIQVIADGPITINAGDISASGTYAWGIAVIETQVNAVNVTFDDIAITQSGAILGGGDGVNIYAAAGAPVSVIGDTVSTTGNYADGVVVGGLGIAGNTTVNVNSITTTGTDSDGVDIGGTGTFNVTVGSVNTSGDASRGLELTTNGGNITAVIGSAGTGGIVTAGAGANDVYATITGAGTISITNNGTTTTRTDNTDAIVTSAVNGSTTITNTGVLRTGIAGAGDNADVVFAQASGTGAITVTNSGTMSTQDLNANAIYTIANSGLTTVNNSGSITTSGANSYGVYSVGTAGAVTVNTTGGSIATTGAASDAIRARSTTGAVTVAQTAGSISTTGAGADGVVALSGSGAVSVTGAGAISTTGAGSYGVIAASTTGAATVNRTGTITTTGANSDGIFASGSTATVTSGSVSVSGVGADGIRATSLTGAAGVTVNGAVAATQGYGAVIVGATTASLTVNSGASLTGGTGFDAVDITSATGTTITNAGTISRIGAGFAIDANGGAATIANSGTISGALDLTGNNDTVTNTGVINHTGASAFGAGNDTVNNNGTYNLTSGTIDFGAGTDTFNNGVSGTTRLNAATATTVTISNLETFNNAGLVDLRNGHTGDVLAMPGAVFTGTGASRLGVDANLETGTADQLQIGDATGVNLIQVNNLGGLGAIGTSVTVVDSTADMTGTEFALDGGSIDQGFVRFQLVFDAATDQFRLLGAPDTEVFQQIRTVGAVQDFWNHSADTWFARTQEIRDAQGSASPTRSEGWEMWAQAHAGSDSFSSTRTFSFGAPAVTTTENLGTDSSWRGFQMGADHMSGNMLWGVTGGFIQQDTDFANNNGLDIEGWNLGAYAGWNSGGLFVNGLIKADWVSVDANIASAGMIATMDGHAWGAAGEVGFRFGGTGFFVEPVASLAWSSTTLDGFSSPVVDFDFDDGTSLRGQVGARVGGSWGAIQPFAGLYAVEEFDGENQVTVTSGATTLVFTDEQRPTYGKADFGFNILGWGGLEGFVKGEALFGDDASGFTGRLGVRWRW